MAEMPSSIEGSGISGLDSMWIVAYLSLWALLTLMLEIPEAHELVAWIAALIAFSATVGLRADLQRNLETLFQ